MLEKLAASVPYAEACVNAEAKLDHITGVNENEGMQGCRSLIWGSLYST